MSGSTKSLSMKDKDHCGLNMPKKLPLLILVVVVNVKRRETMDHY